MALSFGNVKIYPFPAVQYIPLQITPVCSGPILHSTPRTQQPQLLVGQEISKWQDILRTEYGLDQIPVSTVDTFPIIALNLEIDDAKYRSFYVTMTGRKSPGHYHVYTLPRKYFYKNNLFFELFDLQTEQRIGYASTFIK
ncbi:MAG TPA: hypothetical protein PL004_03725 [Bacillota bacterium]|nr:hypothetical protein [Bacillota bacterium]